MTALLPDRVRSEFSDSELIPELLHVVQCHLCIQRVLLDVGSCPNFDNLP